MNLEKYTTIQEDLQIIIDYFTEDDNTVEEAIDYVCKRTGVSKADYLAIMNSTLEPTKYQLEAIYNFAYANYLYLNEIRWQSALDEYRSGQTRVCTHGARTFINGDIRLDANGLGSEERKAIADYAGGESNDFGSGFYIGEDISQAGMFVGQEPNSSLYFLTFNPTKLKCAYFKVDLDWLLAIGLFRGKLSQYEGSKKLQSILDYVDSSDFVYAPIADNKIFETIDSFISGDLTDEQCLHALSATHLGYQYVLKTQACLDNLKVIDHMYYCQLEKEIYNKQSEIETRTSLNKSIIAKHKYKEQGRYINEIL